MLRVSEGGGFCVVIAWPPAGHPLGLLQQVAIYSPADRLQPHRFKANESYCVGTPEMKPIDCYLDVEGILKLAKEVDVDAIHPGYGFLSENTEMARRCEEEGIKFIGPDPDTILVGLKTSISSVGVTRCAGNRGLLLCVKMHLKPFLDRDE